MFKRIREMVETARENAVLAKMEPALQRAARESRRLWAQAELEAVLAAPGVEAYLVAVAAPYRALTTPGALHQRQGDYHPLHLHRMALPEEHHDAWRARLAEDFGVINAADAQGALLAINDAFEQAQQQANHAEMALLGVRVAHLGCAAAGSRLLPRMQVVQQLHPLLPALAATFIGWGELGEAFLRGKDAADATRRGPDVPASLVEELQAHPNSPWWHLPWPAPGDTAGLAAQLQMAAA